MNLFRPIFVTALTLATAACSLAGRRLEAGDLVFDTDTVGIEGCCLRSPSPPGCLPESRFSSRIP